MLRLPQFERGFAARQAVRAACASTTAPHTFRYAQPVTGYVRVSGNAVDVLVQPADMNPSSVSKCDCLYDISLHIPRLAARML